MKLLDVHVLVALFRQDHALHSAAQTWWNGAAESREPFLVPDVVWVGFVRIVTSSRIYFEPASLMEAFDFLDAVRAQPHHLATDALPPSIDVFKQLTIEVTAQGNLVSDCYLAAIAKTLGATIVTLDRDFRLFDGVRREELH